MSSTQIQPRGDRVLVEIDYKPENVTAGGVIIPAATKAAPQTGKIVAIGPGLRNDAGELLPIAGIDVGDIVMYAKHAGTPVEADGIVDDRTPKLALYREADILAVVSHA